MAIEGKKKPKFNFTPHKTVYEVQGYQCQGYFKHFHRTEWGAMQCQHLQSLLPMLQIYHSYLKWFNPEKYKKILAAFTGGRRRHAIRRIKRGAKAI